VKLQCVRNHTHIVYDINPDKNEFFAVVVMMIMMKEYSKTTIIVASVVFICLVVGGYLLFTSNSQQDRKASQDSQKTEVAVEFSKIEDKAKARQLRSITPEPSEFSDSFSITNQRFTKDSQGGSLRYVTQWSNQQAKQLQKYRNDSGPKPDNPQRVARNAKFFTLIIGDTKSATKPITEMKEGFSELPSRLQPYLKKGIAEKRDLATVGTGQFSYRLTQPGSPVYRDYYNFHRDDYVVKFSMFTSFNDSAFKDLILPKARIIDQKIQNLE